MVKSLCHLLEKLQKVEFIPIFVQIRRIRDRMHHIFNFYKIVNPAFSHRPDVYYPAMSALAFAKAVPYRIDSFLV